MARGASVLAVDLPSDDFFTGRESDSSYRLGIDLTTEAAPVEIISTAVKTFGRLDILVNNAGIASVGGAESTPDVIWRKIMSVNVDAVFRVTREAIPHLKQSSAGRVINMGSLVSEAAGAHQIAYTISKHAVAGMTKAMAVDLGKHNITANFLQPGSIRTPLIAKFIAQPGVEEAWCERTPLGRVGEPIEVAAAAAFLASNDASYISGAGLRIDGGALVVI